MRAEASALSGTSEMPLVNTVNTVGQSDAPFPVSSVFQSDSVQFPRIAERLNRVRLARALALLTPLQRHLVRLIPVLFHHHHPKLPGYNDPLTPHGIVDYCDSPAALDACSRLQLTLPQMPLSAPALEGIYTMGSTGSFGQNIRSDIDVWLVHERELNQAELALLRDKADKLSQWFGRYQLEVNFYLVHPQQFMAEQPLLGPDIVLGHEHSGSAQRWLLLEEFYRSQICLGGKQLAWWPDAKPDSGLLTLGDVHQVPASEYLGAALWQLYKGLEKPHKALLKVLLLEAYASSYPNTVLISDLIWQRTASGDFSAGNDPYFVLYEVIERYLLQAGDQRRLEIARRCFYLKCGIRLTRPDQAKDWRYHKLQALVSNWGWDAILIAMLDNCEHWHAGQLLWFNRQLNELMLASYQTLLLFAASREMASNMRIAELGMLTRKLHTSFNSDARRLLKLNLLWSHCVAEADLVLSRAEADAANGYSLYRLNDNSRGELLYQAGQLASVLSWACINGIATDKTRWYWQAQSDGSLTADKTLQQTVKALLQQTGGPCARVSKQDLCNPWHFTQVVMLLNMDDDPTARWQGQEIMVDYMNASVFALGRQRRNMLGSVDVLCLNNWGEYHCHHFTGDTAVLQALAFVAPGLKRAGDDVQLQVISHARKLGSQLSRSVLTLLQQAARLSRHQQSATTLLQPLQIGPIRYGLFYNTQGLAWQDLSDAKSLYQQFSRGQLLELPRPELGDNPLAGLPELVQRYAACGVTQYFLRQQGADLDVLVLDEHNLQQHYIQKDSDINAMVSQVSHQFVFDEHHAVNGRFNMPQFFHLSRVDGALSLAPFGVAPEELSREF